MGQGLRQGGIREGVRITIYHAYYYLVIRCSVLTFLHGYFKACKNSHVRWTRLKNSALTLEVIDLPRRPTQACWPMRRTHGQGGVPGAGNAMMSRFSTRSRSALNLGV